MKVSPLIQGFKGAAFGRFCYRTLGFLGVLCGLMGIVGCDDNQIYTTYFGDGCFTLNTTELDWVSSTYYSANAGKRVGMVHTSGTLQFSTCQEGNRTAKVMFTVESKHHPSKVKAAYLQSTIKLVTKVDSTIVCPKSSSVCENPKLIASGLAQSGRRWNRYQLDMLPHTFYKFINSDSRIALLYEPGDTFYVEFPKLYKPTVGQNMLKAIDTTMYR